MKFADQLAHALDTYRPPSGAAVRRSHPVTYMHAKGLLSPEEYAAALIFGASWEVAQGSQGTTADWGAFPAMALSDEARNHEGQQRASKRVTRVPSGPRRIADSKAELEQAHAAVGPLGFQVLRAVCGMGVPLAAVATLLGVHRDIVSFRFREALQVLTDFYRGLYDIGGGDE